MGPVVILFLGVIGWILFEATGQLFTRRMISELGVYYLSATRAEVGIPNVVAAILFDYRMFDTLGETTVVFASVAGIVLLFHRRVFERSWVGLAFLPRWGLGLVAPLIFTYGASLVLHGHLSPGGGFQGGVVWATLSILLAAVYGVGFEAVWFSPTRKTIVECTAALGFVFVAGMGIYYAGVAFANLQAGFPEGVFGTVLSGGTVPLLNLLSGLKVGSGMSIIFLTMAKRDVDAVDSQVS